MPATETAIELVPAVKALWDVRRDHEVVVTTMGPSREWMALGSHPLDLVFVPSSMGQATSLGLGIALSQPQRKVIVCNGDGSMLMNLGSLVTITAQQPKNLTVILFDNGVYEVTGAQATPGSSSGRGDGRNVDFASMARASGFERVFQFTDLARWQSSVRQLIDEPGPTFIHLRILPVPGAVGPKSPGKGSERAVRFAAALAGK